MARHPVPWAAWSGRIELGNQVFVFENREGLEGTDEYVEQDGSVLSSEPKEKKMVFWQQDETRRNHHFCVCEVSGPELVQVTLVLTCEQWIGVCTNNGDKDHSGALEHRCHDCKPVPFTYVGLLEDCVFEATTSRKIDWILLKTFLQGIS
ncbi:hypothetical protein TNIN_395261 [Trichonephila inaurata madagascariensis]|uniref:Uncharacterized protein n=1 Tax=Trichonephila inaurata madagascariensis TaxID=2747483 RepID=A0A8X7CTW6_9ARAC|nr:hypothetical protein TNIN_395261 [Trichonephila inaurata madagascariensis]